MIFRENTKGHYVGVGGNFKKGTEEEVAVQEDVNTYKGVERIIRYAFDYAQKTGRKRLVMSDKSNALTFGHGLWQRVYAEIWPKYPDIQSAHMYVDNLAFQLVRDPAQFDVIVACNLFGDILSDLGAGLVGGLGIAPSANINPKGLSMFEPVHGSAPDQAGKDTANPIATILTAGMMLDHLGLSKEVGWIDQAVRASLQEEQTTVDLGGALGTQKVGDWLVGYIAKRASVSS
jgi:3-isopropylmalate dehydrogenase